MKVTIELEIFDTSILCDQETINEHYQGSWEIFLRQFLDEEGLPEFIDWFDTNKITKVEES